MERTHKNGELNITNLGQEVVVAGWASKIRNFGAITFVDLRDRSGIVQVVIKTDEIKVDIRNEYVLEVLGVVTKRETPNPNLKSGEIEVSAKEVNVLNTAKTTPLIIADETDALEDVRLKYRYLDLRRPTMQHNLDIRNAIKMATHEYLNNQGFIEVETPILNLSTPEGARDFLVPSRLKKGSFYALPQSPQIFKQLLMISGIEKYYQIAHCFRDEDLRSDRQPEFTQIDIEMSFMSQKEVISLVEGLVKNIFKEAINIDIQTPFKQISYESAVKDYGSDKPDTRYDLKLVCLKDIVKDSDFSGFHAEAVRGIVIPGVSETTTRKVIDDLTSEGKKYLVEGTSVLKLDSKNTLSGGIVKFLSESQQKEIIAKTGLKSGDILIISWGDYKRVSFFLGALRVDYAKQLHLTKEGTYDLVWVVDFPLFERDVEGNITSVHHPFTRPNDSDLEKLESDPLGVSSYAYDLILNGNEIGGGSLRIYDQEVQKRVFKVLGLSDSEVKKRFGFFLEAFQYGTPPHAGIAFGLDRLTMILCASDNIRDVIAFPKNLSGGDPMSGAPTEVDKSQLDELALSLLKEEK
ncbi:MAG: aspartate--tRNA ligase [Coprobacillus sp.]|nr:aspartate--tRNA ligase [Coprobacillus sp.]